MKEFYTTGEVAKICEIGIITVKKYNIPLFRLAQKKK